MFLKQNGSNYPKKVLYVILKTEALLQDPGVYKGYTRAAVAVQYIAAVNALRTMMPSMTFPVLALHSPDDTLTDIHGSEYLIHTSAASDKQFHSTPGMWHDLIQEAGSDAVFSIVSSWLEDRS